jgi:recombination protein RecA
MDENRQKALGAALAQIEKQFGTGSIMRMGDPGAFSDIEVVSTGSLTLDIALGVGGLPKGRVVEVYGPESSGKTTLMPSMRLIRSMRKNSGLTSKICWFPNRITESRR